MTILQNGATLKIGSLPCIHAVRVGFKESNNNEVTKAAEATSNAFRATELLMTPMPVSLTPMIGSIGALVLMVYLWRFWKRLVTQSTTLALLFHHPFVFALAHTIGVYSAIFLFVRSSLTFPSPTEDRTIQVPFSRWLELGAALGTCLW
jgi:hypothetical protein